MKKAICLHEFKPRWEDIVIPKDAIVDILHIPAFGSMSAQYQGVSFSIALFSFNSYFKGVQ